MKTILIVCGEREWKDKEHIYEVLDGELYQHELAWFLEHGVTGHASQETVKAARADFILRHGICEGADWIANDWGLERGVTIERFPAKWNDHTGYHPEAGPIRNKEMARAEPRAQLCLAFWSGKLRVKAGKKLYSGTFDMIQAALGEGIRVRIEPPRKEVT